MESQLLTTVIIENPKKKINPLLSILILKYTTAKKPTQKVKNRAEKMRIRDKSIYVLTPWILNFMTLLSVSNLRFKEIEESNLILLSFFKPSFLSP